MFHFIYHTLCAIFVFILRFVQLHVLIDVNLCNFFIFCCNILSFYFILFPFQILNTSDKFTVLNTYKIVIFLDSKLLLTCVVCMCIFYEITAVFNQLCHTFNFLGFKATHSPDYAIKIKAKQLQAKTVY